MPKRSLGFNRFPKIDSNFTYSIITSFLTIKCICFIKTSLYLIKKLFNLYPITRNKRLH